MFHPPNRIPLSVIVIMAAMLAGFLAIMIVPGWTMNYLGLVPARVLGSGWLWQPVTYMALHGGILHFLFNLLTLYLFATPLASLWGEAKFLRYFFFCGIAAAVATLALMPGSWTPTIGASGAIYGLLLAWAMEFPDSVIYFYGIVPMRAKHFVIFIAILELLLSQTPSPIARFAHLGGLVAGWLYLRFPQLPWRLRLTFTWRAKRRAEVPLHQEVDRILEKISRSGLNSLTKEERCILDKASRTIKSA